MLGACTFGNGRVCGPQTPAAYCDREAYMRLMYPKLYGEHWVKEGMTQESRLDDTVACGSARTERLGFSDEKKRLERRPEESDDAKAVGRLTERWVQCMKSKGYHYEP